MVKADKPEPIVEKAAATAATKPPVATAKPVAKAPVAPKIQAIELPTTLTVRELGNLLHLGPVDIIKQLMRNGVMANVNQVIDYQTAAVVISSLGYEPRLKQAKRRLAVKGIEKKVLGEDAGRLKHRPPVVTIMGHVDHGKTRLLDAIRQTNVMDSEAGGITQHIGAYQVEKNGQLITFIDTPGHEAFTTMRARGAQVTDIVVLVVAADDGIMPQTLEAIDHARAAAVPIIVAINKIDKPEANPDRVKTQLADAGLVVEDWGGETIAVGTSAKTKQGIDDLLENILLVAEILDLKADPTLPGEGIVIEAKMDKTKGPLATVLVQNGTLKLGDVIVVGNTSGKVKAMFNDAGKRVKKTDPATPAELLGLESVPEVGDKLKVVPSENQARTMVEARQREQQLKANVSLSNLYAQITTGNVKELNIILKADVQGSIEPIKTSLEQVSTPEVKVKIIHTGAGNVTESDVLLAAASKGLVIGFSVGIEPGAKRLAQVQNVDINSYDIIYALIDDVAKATKGMLTPVFKEVIDGRAEVRAIFPSAHKRKIAGIYVTEGKLIRNSKIRVLRKGAKLAEDGIMSMRRTTEDIREVLAGYEAGIVLETFNAYQVGDILESFRSEKVS